MQQVNRISGRDNGAKHWNKGLLHVVHALHRAGIQPAEGTVGHLGQPENATLSPLQEHLVVKHTCSLVRSKAQDLARTHTYPLLLSRAAHAPHVCVVLSGSSQGHSACRC